MNYKKYISSTIVSLILLVVYYLTRDDIKTVATTVNNNVLGKTSKGMEYAKVVRVVDGDTITLENGDTVRYIGINTPELNIAKPEKGVECFAKEASNRNTELILNKTVRLVSDKGDKDRYGRFLRYIYLDDLFINDILVKEGYAKTMTYAPNVKYKDLFAASETAAKNKNIGLWAKCK